MFGRKKDEDLDYSGEYYQDNNCDQNYPEQDMKYSDEYKDKLKEVFGRNLMDGEQILCVSGGGDTNAKNPFESDGKKKKYDAFTIAKYVFVIMFCLVFLGGIFGGKIFKGADIVFDIITVLFVFLGPIFFIAVVILIMIWYAKKGQKGLSYAITDRRVICYAYNQWQEIPLQCITNTSVKMKNGNIGNINITARNVPNMGNYVRYMVPWIDDPYRVKSMLDAAIENCKANQY